MNALSAAGRLWPCTLLTVRLWLKRLLPPSSSSPTAHPHPRLHGVVLFGTCKSCFFHLLLPLSRLFAISYLLIPGATSHFLPSNFTVLTAMRWNHMCSHLSRPLCSSKTLIATYSDMYEICVCLQCAQTFVWRSSLYVLRSGSLTLWPLSGNSQ